MLFFVSTRGRSCRSWQLLCCAGLLTATHAHASPSAQQTLVASTTPPAAQWIAHEVIPGERLAEIAERYAVSTASLMRWNKIDASKPIYRAGQKLRVQTRVPARTRHKLQYVVREGDSWAKIAQHHGVSQRALQHAWNHVEGTLRAGQTVVVWVDARSEDPLNEVAPSAATGSAATPEATQASAASVANTLPIITVSGQAQSVGRPDRGYLASGLQLPQNDALYTVRNPARAYGSSHAITLLQQGIARFRETTGFRGRLVIGDMSDSDGGRFRPHKSHRTGRDVDIALPLRAGSSVVDWHATYQLISAFIATGQVRFIFLSRSRQAALYRAAKKIGASRDTLARIIEFPRRRTGSIVRHSRGHTKHMHVRFKCGPLESACVEP